MPEWWDRWCWLWLVMLVWAAFWMVVGFGNDFATGFQAGMVLFWIAALMDRATKFWMRRSIEIHENLHEIDRKIQDSLYESLRAMTDRLREKEGW